MGKRRVSMAWQAADSTRLILRKTLERPLGCMGQAWGLGFYTKFYCLHGLWSRGDNLVNSSLYLSLECLGHSLSASETKEDSSREGRNRTCPQYDAIRFNILLQGETPDPPLTPDEVFQLKRQACFWHNELLQRGKGSSVPLNRNWVNPR